MDRHSNIIGIGESKILAKIANRLAVYVITGPLYEREIGTLPGADETHFIPSGYWKIVLVQTGSNPSTIKSSSFIFDQNTESGMDVFSGMTTINEIEDRTGLDFLWEIPDDLEDEIEGNLFREWSEGILN